MQQGLIKKYQVFVSSTYLDLQEERQEVMKALLELDCIPSGMEFFPAADDDQWTLIKGVIDECDYYIVIVGGRYGSLSAEGISYTEKEYRYALTKGKPIIAFLHNDPDSLPKKKSEMKAEAIEKLEEFRILVQKKMCKSWTTAHELGAVVSRSFIQLQKTHPAIGWVRANLVPEKDSSSEILELKREIERLQNQIENSRTQIPKGSEKLAQGDDKFIIHYSCKSNDGSMASYMDTHSWTGVITTTWNGVFYEISPELIDEASERIIRSTINELVKKNGLKDFKLNKDAKGHKFSHFQANDEDFQTIKVQLRALGLIAQSTKKRNIKDTDTYWTLTPYGDTIMTQLRAIKKED